MVAEFGHYCLILAWFVALSQVVVSFAFRNQISIQFFNFCKSTALVQMILCVAAFVALIVCFVITDLSVLNVVMNSHSAKPMLYKISGAWGNHEGSLLLWVTLLAVFGFCMSRAQYSELTARAVSVQSLLTLGFLGFLLFTSNPFERIDPAPIDGQGLNPLLQDPGLAFHPPLLYIGYVAFSVAFSYAVAALISREVPAHWPTLVRPWVLFAWTSLSAGIGLGSWWAYYELGWGGWWFWDPVENASLLPWLVGTALLHSLIVSQHRGALVRWGVLLCILSFTFAMLGTFLVRSGILTSVHAFATDPERGVFLLGLVFLYCGSAFFLYAVRTHNIPEGKPFAALSRESFIVINNLFFMVATVTVLLGTLYPLILSALNIGQISVGPPYFEATFVPIAVPMIMMAGIAPFIGWKRGTFSHYGPYFAISLALVLAGLLAAYCYYASIHWTAMLGFSLGFWLITSSGLAVYRRSDRWSAPLSFWAMIVGHLGVGVAIVGMVGTSILKVEEMAILGKGETLTSGRYIVEYKGTDLIQEDNYLSYRGQIEVREKDTLDFVANLTPEKRHYPVANSTTTEASIHTNMMDDIYVALGNAEDDDQWVVRAFTHPLVMFLWSGFSLIVFSGALALTGFLRRKV